VRLAEYDHVVDAFTRAYSSLLRLDLLLLLHSWLQLLTLREHLLIVELLQDRLEIPGSLAGQVI